MSLSTAEEECRCPRRHCGRVEHNVASVFCVLHDSVTTLHTIPCKPCRMPIVNLQTRFVLAPANSSLHRAVNARSHCKCFESLSVFENTHVENTHDRFENTQTTQCHVTRREHHVEAQGCVYRHAVALCTSRWRTRCARAQVYRAHRGSAAILVCASVRHLHSNVLRPDAQ
jgi:hypothetical protein